MKTNANTLGRSHRRLRKQADGDSAIEVAGINVQLPVWQFFPGIILVVRGFDSATQNIAGIIYITDLNIASKNLAYDDR